MISVYEIKRFRAWPHWKLLSAFFPNKRKTSFYDAFSGHIGSFLDFNNFTLKPLFIFIVHYTLSIISLDLKPLIVMYFYTLISNFNRKKKRIIYSCEFFVSNGNREHGSDVFRYFA